MKNYDSNDMKNRYNYREEDKKKKKAHNKNTLPARL